MPDSDRISATVSSFRGRALPVRAALAGYAYLIDQFDLAVPLPPRLTAIAGKHRPREGKNWLILPESYAPASSLAAEIAFAFKWEGLDLAVLEALFRKTPAEVIAEAVRTAPTGAYMRRLWFIYEWLRDERLDIADLGKVKAADAVNPIQQVALVSGPISARHKVRDNLPGTREFCPMVRRTTAIKEFENKNLAARAAAVLSRTHPDVLTRAATFLLLSDSRASYRIEGEEPSPDRTRRWGQAIARAGTTRLSLKEFDALQRIVIGDSRFVKIGLRKEGGFVGEHDRLTSAPIPEHISARHEDLPSLMTGLVEYDERAGRGDMDPIAAAAVESFGFVYIHPFEDGNGRIHRWLIHHILEASGFAPSGLAFPVSAVMLRELDSYRRVLESYSRPLLAQIEWRATGTGNVEVLNDTAAWYRYFDATAHVEFLYHCVETTIEHDLPREVAFLEAYDKFAERVKILIDMPGRTLDLLHRFLAQNDGRFSRRAREHEFAALTDDEATRIEAIYAEAHGTAAS
jgi:hypothetical protein